jgi:transposase InsO family protein
VYRAVVLDSYSRRVVGWSIDATQTATLVTNALIMAIANRAPDRSQGTVIHSDHGVQAVHLLGLHPEGARIRTGALHGPDRRLL